MQHTIENNISATILNKLLNPFKLISPDKNLVAWRPDGPRNFISKAPTLDMFAENLSGGNQQRVVVAKWLATNPVIFILDSPTVGIDIASKAEIHAMIHDLAACAWELSSFPMKSLKCYNRNRVLVMKTGKIIGEFEARQTTEEEVFALVF